MKSYNVQQISEMLHTNPETVRRWIRQGKLKSTMTSTKSGNIITEEALNKFVKTTPKYASLLAASIASSPLALSVIVGGLLGSIMAIADERKSNKVTEDDVKKSISKKIASYEKSIASKKEELLRLKSEIACEQKNLEKYKYALEQLDLSLIVSEINSEN